MSDVYFMTRSSAHFSGAYPMSTGLKVTASYFSVSRMSVGAIGNTKRGVLIV